MFARGRSGKHGMWVINDNGHSIMDNAGNVNKHGG